MAASPDEILSMVFFVRVVEAGSFTGAAAKLGVSKSVVSGRVAGLEHQLQVRLLHRTTRKLALTPEGLALYERCLPLVTAADDASAAVAGTGKTPRGVLRLNAPVVFAEKYLAPPIAAYLERYPDVRAEITLNDKPVDLVEEGIDVAIRITSRLQGAGLVARKLAADHTVLCASPAYLERHGVPAAAGELVHHHCLVYSLLKVAEEWRFREGKETFTVPVEGRFWAGSGALLRSAALAGIGLAVLPTFMIAEDLAAGRLRRVLDSFQGVALGIYAVYPETRPIPSKTRAFVELLLAYFRTPRW
jgi:DNA-binding transcriptional LysR family regulator